MLLTDYSCSFNPSRIQALNLTDILATHLCRSTKQKVSEVSIEDYYPVSSELVMLLFNFHFMRASRGGQVSIKRVMERKEFVPN